MGMTEHTGANRGGRAALRALGANYRGLPRFGPGAVEVPVLFWYVLTPLQYIITLPQIRSYDLRTVIQAVLVIGLLLVGTFSCRFHAGFTRGYLPHCHPIITPFLGGFGCE